ncbi:ComEC family competence protein [Cytophagaceae bacterium 50C-KIRBA]|uniref:ComEC family competence protein n=1 Tax=Aquirufa beregesia TaxID=2516556 RepID=A0ABX0F257_9BACT|nr:ComEC/Rec2 family competence protein [Aquirufa beregesia]NGZ43935.1 ComEC family competence protein [Aquirufa beregesia]
MFSFFSTFPFLRLCLWWALGVILVPENRQELGYDLLFCLFLLGLLFLIIWIKNRPIFNAYLLSLACFCAGYLRTLDVKNLYQKLPSDVIAFRFQLVSSPIKKPKTYAFVGEISNYLNSKGEWRAIQTRSQFYLEHTADIPKLGDIYLSKAHLQAIRPAAFPFGQNWPAYFARKGIYSTAFLPAKWTKRLQYNERDFVFKAFFERVQQDLLQHLHRALPGERNRAVGGAMLLGGHESIDFETRKSYAALGAIHILSVSGMHVGILFLCIQFFLTFIPRRNRITSIGVFLLPFLLIWMYAGITGFSAPVLRASWMFSVVLFAQTFRYSLNSINLLAFTGFVMLVWDPMQVYDAGFQLSFLAVLGILIYQPSLSVIWEPNIKNPIGQYIVKQAWSLTTVAVAAQALTFPWILYYFHQFPHVGIMLLANPLLVLLSSVSLILGLVFLLIAPILYAWDIIYLYIIMGQVLNASFTLLHEVMFWIDGVFQPTIPFLHWENWMFVSYYLMLILVKYWWDIRHGAILAFFGLVLLCSVSYVEWEQWKALKNQKIAYLGQYRGEPVWLELQGLKAKLLASRRIFQDPAWIQSNISPVLAHHFIEDTVQVKWEEEKNVSWQWKGKRFYRVQQPQVMFSAKIDVLIIDSKLKKQGFDWLKSKRGGDWLWTQSLSSYYLKKLAQFDPLPGHQMALDTVMARGY